MDERAAALNAPMKRSRQTQRKQTENGDLQCTRPQRATCCGNRAGEGGVHAEGIRRFRKSVPAAEPGHVIYAGELAPSDEN